jgi:hypothetical protein
LARQIRYSHREEEVNKNTMRRNRSKNCKALADLQGKTDYELLEELIHHNQRKKSGEKTGRTDEKNDGEQRTLINDD